MRYDDVDEDYALERAIRDRALRVTRWQRQMEEDPRVRAEYDALISRLLHGDDDDDEE